jgi:hypothetical protein
MKAPLTFKRCLDGKELYKHVLETSKTLRIQVPECRNQYFTDP